MLALLLAICADGQPVEKSNAADVLPKGSFPVEKEGALKKIPLHYLLNIEAWSWFGDRIVCKSSGTDSPFYCLDPVNFSVVDSVGKIGPGPGELIAPHFVSGARRWMVADNGRREIIWYEGGRIVGKTGLKTGAALNAPALYADSLICFIENTPHQLAWRLYNYETGREVTHIAFQDKEQKGKAEQYDFTYATGKNFLAIARLYSDQVFIYEMGNGKTELRHTIRGTTEEGKFYYSSVVCSGDRLYLLNQEEVDLAAGTGRSRIEIYSLDGKPQARIAVPLIADRFLVDRQRGRILLLSPFDDDHVYALSM